MKYLYETHCHTDITSKCSKFTPQEIVDTYVKNGYTGVIITDHFINANCVLEIRELESYQDKIHRFFEGYRQVKELAENKLDVFCGFEYGYKGTDILTYGFDEQKTLDNPQMMDMSPKEYIDFINLSGGLTIQAHPFREAHYIDHIRLFTNVSGIEVLNTDRTKMCNDLAYNLWEQYNANVCFKIKTGGSDIHSKTHPILSGVAFESKITSIEDFISRLKNGEGEIFTKENVINK